MASTSANQPTQTYSIEKESTQTIRLARLCQCERPYAIPDLLDDYNGINRQIEHDTSCAYCGRAIHRKPRNRDGKDHVLRFNDKGTVRDTVERELRVIATREQAETFAEWIRDALNADNLRGVAKYIRPHAHYQTIRAIANRSGVFHSLRVFGEWTICTACADGDCRKLGHRKFRGYTRRG